MKTCCFIGHRKVDKTDELSKKIRETVVSLILKESVNIFYFGSASAFDNLCLDIVLNIKKEYPNIKLVYVRSHFPYINDNYTDYLLKTYDDTFIPSRVINAGRASYVERNQEMIKASDFCIFYYNENYKAPKKRDVLFCRESKSGTKNAFEYAIKNKKIIFNLYKEN